jgi:hypothetical protein
VVVAVEGLEKIDFDNPQVRRESTPLRLTPFRGFAFGEISRHLVFLSYVEQRFVPTLKPNDITVVDNLVSHKVLGVADAIEAAGLTLRYPPQHSHALPHQFDICRADLPRRRSCRGSVRLAFRSACTRTLQALT